MAAHLIPDEPGHIPTGDCRCRPQRRPYRGRYAYHHNDMPDAPDDDEREETRRAPARRQPGLATR